jgi:hypothetical protein
VKILPLQGDVYCGFLEPLVLSGLAQYLVVSGVQARRVHYLCQIPASRMLICSNFRWKLCKADCQFASVDGAIRGSSLALNPVQAMNGQQRSSRRFRQAVLACGVVKMGESMARRSDVT